MFNPTPLEKIIRKIKHKSRPFLAPFRRKLLSCKDFTIISNNCWGGLCYEYFGLPKQSPTIGVFFFASEYILFVKNLRHYLAEELIFIDIAKSKHYNFLKERNIHCPIGLIDDVEIIFLHYPSEKIAKEKWIRRVERVNWDNLVFKFSQMNDCSLKDLEDFDNLDLPGKKIMFVNKPGMGFKSGIYYPGYEDDSSIENDTFYWNKYLDVVHFLNG
jgi:uncharacterized protein (DUF1919 family)